MAVRGRERLCAGRARMCVLIAATVLSLVSTAALAQPVTPASPVAVVVNVPTPPGAPRTLIEGGIRKSVPQYRQVPGLLRKYFTIGEGNLGGVYLFASRAAAEGWFNNAWHKRVIATYGRDGTVTYYDVPVVLDNAAVPASALATK